MSEKPDEQEINDEVERQATKRVLEPEIFRRTLRAINMNALAWHAGEDGKARALKVIAVWTSEALAGRLHPGVEAIEPPELPAVERVVAHLSPEDAKKGARMLWRLNDWLVDSGIGFVLDQEELQAFGALAVKLQRRATADE